MDDGAGSCCSSSQVPSLSHVHNIRVGLGGDCGDGDVKKGQRLNGVSTLRGIDISVDLYIDMQVIFSL